jgi:hypothetical protein
MIMQDLTLCLFAHLESNKVVLQDNLVVSSCTFQHPHDIPSHVFRATSGES